MSDAVLQSHAPISPRSVSPPFLILGTLGLVIVGAALWLGSAYNRLVRLDQGVQAQWAQVENAYQRRADLVPNLVETVKGAAGFEKQTLLAVTEARAQILRPQGTAPSAEALEKYQTQQQQLGAALSKLMVVVEAYPQLRAIEGFRNLQAQLEGTENRIAVERMRFNLAAQNFNTARHTFPTNLAAAAFGQRFADKAFFKANEGAERPPPVKF